MTKKRDYKAEYARRAAKAKAEGVSAHDWTHGKKQYKARQVQPTQADLQTQTVDAKWRRIENYAELEGIDDGEILSWLHELSKRTSEKEMLRIINEIQDGQYATTYAILEELLPDPDQAMRTFFYHG